MTVFSYRSCNTRKNIRDPSEDLSPRARQFSLLHWREFGIRGRRCHEAQNEITIYARHSHRMPNSIRAPPSRQIFFPHLQLRLHSQGSWRVQLTVVFSLKASLCWDPLTVIMAIENSWQVKFNLGASEDPASIQKWNLGDPLQQNLPSCSQEHTFT